MERLLLVKVQLEIVLHYCVVLISISIILEGSDEVIGAHFEYHLSSEYFFPGDCAKSSLFLIEFKRNSLLEQLGRIFFNKIRYFS